MDFILCNQGEGFGEGDAEDFDLLVGLGLGDAGADFAREVDLHPFAEEAGAGKVFGEESPLFAR